MTVARAQGLFRARLTRLKYLAPPEPLLPPTLCGQWGAEHGPLTRSIWLPYFPRKDSDRAFNEKLFNLKRKHLTSEKLIHLFKTW